MRTDAEISKYPALRDDLKISKQVLLEKTSFIVKDPVKGQYFRFDQEEWGIISLFDGKSTLEEIVARFNQSQAEVEIDLELVKDYQESLESMNLLEKSSSDYNFMLIEKMKEMRRSQLLSKKGSITYKRFPLVDPDKFFDRIVPKMRWVWTPQFFWFAVACMAIAVGIVLSNWREVGDAAHQLFSFSQMSFENLFVLWVTIYVTIAIHELGHGLTCKHYGGEVHEMGFLLLFFQPCLYCNVNDAWLFDKKYKQVLVTIAGGFIEFFIGSICAMIWFVTNPGTFVNTLAFQVMTVCSVSTVLFNFNPLIKLDGYYLLADYLETANLKESSFDYLKHFVAKYVFRVKVEEFEATRREKRIFLTYGILSFFWQVSLMTGMFMMIRGLLIQHFYEVGVMLSLPAGIYLLKSQIKKSGAFALKWYLEKRELLKNPKVLKGFKIGGAAVGIVLLFPIRYGVPGDCTLEPSFVRVIRAQVTGTIQEFRLHDGETIEPGSELARMQSPQAHLERAIASYDIERQKYKIQKAIAEDAAEAIALAQEMEAKKLALAKKSARAESVAVTYQDEIGGSGMLSCEDEVRRLGTLVKEGDPICKVLGVDTLKSVVRVTEQEVRFIQQGDPVEFWVKASPFSSYEGKVQKIRMLSQSDPLNPKARLFEVEMEITNTGALRPGMSGKAKILSRRVPVVQYMGRKLALFFRMDLFL